MVAASLSSYTLYSTYSQLYIDIQYSTVQYIRYVEVFNRDGRAVLVFFLKKKQRIFTFCKKVRRLTFSVEKVMNRRFFVNNIRIHDDYSMFNTN